MPSSASRIHGQDGRAACVCLDGLQPSLESSYVSYVPEHHVLPLALYVFTLHSISSQCPRRRKEVDASYGVYRSSPAGIPASNSSITVAPSKAQRSLSPERTPRAEYSILRSDYTIVDLARVWFRIIVVAPLAGAMGPSIGLRNS